LNGFGHVRLFPGKAQFGLVRAAFRA
jgi:hypothetical protein